MDERLSKVGFQQAVTLAAAGACGKEPLLQVQQIDEWPFVVQLAMSQSVLPLVGCAMLKNSGVDMSNEMHEQIIEHTRMIAAKNQIKQQRIMWLINELERAGVDVKLIKGYAVADCYVKPECRRSEDTDLLIQPEQEQAAYQVLRNLGFRVDRRNATSHHAVCQHPKHGMVELHVQLYDELIHDGWFSAIPADELIKEPSIRVNTVNGAYTTLGYSDHALFLAIHMVKHFIGVGINIRMMLDVALFISKNKADIDFNRFWSILRKLHFECVVNSVLSIMVRTGCFDWSEFPGACESTDDQVDVFIRDVVSGAAAPRASQEDNTYYEYSKAVMQKSMGHTKYCVYMIKWALRNAKSQICPGREQLLVLYNVDKQKKWLIPFLQIRRLIDLPLQKFRSGITPKRLLDSGADNNTVVADRMKVFRKLDMI